MSWCDDTAAKKAGGSDRGFPTPRSHSFPNTRHRARLWSATGSKCHQKCDSPSRVTGVTWVTHHIVTFRQILSGQPEHYQLETRQSGLWEYDVWSLMDKIKFEWIPVCPDHLLHCASLPLSPLWQIIFTDFSQKYNSEHGFVSMMLSFWPKFPNERLHFLLKV